MLSYQQNLVTRSEEAIAIGLEAIATNVTIKSFLSPIFLPLATTESRRGPSERFAAAETAP